jgi:isopenicillin N synthase-like dioxygenase
LSYVAPNYAGLEIEIDGRMRPESFEGGEVLIMPGSLLTIMTGGAVPPMYHQVRNHHLSRRMTVLYFVNTPMQGQVAPYVVNESNRDLDMALISRKKCTLFGKSEPPILA